MIDGVTIYGGVLFTCENDKFFKKQIHRHLFDSHVFDCVVLFMCEDNNFQRRDSCMIDLYASYINRVPPIIMLFSYLFLKI